MEVINKRNQGETHHLREKIDGKLNVAGSNGVRRGKNYVRSMSAQKQWARTSLTMQ